MTHTALSEVLATEYAGTIHLSVALLDGLVSQALHTEVLEDTYGDPALTLDRVAIAGLRTGS